MRFAAFAAGMLASGALYYEGRVSEPLNFAHVRSPSSVSMGLFPAVGTRSVPPSLSLSSFFKQTALRQASEELAPSLPGYVPPKPIKDSDADLAIGLELQASAARKWNGVVAGAARPVLEFFTSRGL
jgi:hypothetical protein